MFELINIGCCGSSGSTFLAKSLDNHPDIACGDELNLFMNSNLYNNYGKVKLLLPIIKKYGLQNNPYSRDGSFFANLESYDLDKKTAWDWLKKSKNINELASEFENHILDYANKKIWAEKTPKNIYVAHLFLDSFPNSKFIHIVRNPKDVMLSLIGRNYSIVEAAQRWMVSVASAQKVKDRDNVLEIRYEDLVLENEKIMKKLCSFIGVEYKKEFFSSDKYSSKKLHKFSGHSSWHTSADNSISKKSLFKYKDSKIKFNKIYSMKLTEEYSSFLNIPQYSLTDMANIYNYDIHLDDKKVEFLNRVVNYKRYNSNKMRFYNFVLRNDNYINKVIY
jgi:hypothetical protein